MRIEKVGWETRVWFEYIQPSGRIANTYVSAKKPSEKYDEPAMINITATGDIRLGKVSEITKAIELAVMIASGELEID